MKHAFTGNQTSIFAASKRGSGEWGAFSAVQGDRVDMYRVRTPRQAEWPRYPNAIRIHRYPRHLTLKVVH